MKKFWVMGLWLFAMAANATDTMFIGFQDYNRSPIQAVQDSRGFTAYMSRVLGVPVKVETIRGHDKLISKAKQKAFGLIFAPASMIMEAKDVAGYEPIVRVPGQLAAAFAAPAKSGIAFPEDMKGKRIGFTDRDSMMTLLALAKLRDMHIDPAKYFKSVTFYNDIDGVYTAFKYGLIDVGVANSIVYSSWNSDGRMDLNLIMQSEGAPHLTFAVRGDYPAALKQKITEALLNAHNDPAAVQSFRGAGFPDFVPVDMKQYNAMVTYFGTKK